MSSDYDNHWAGRALDVTRPEDDEVIQGSVFSIQFEITYTCMPSDQKDEDGIDSLQHLTIIVTREVQRDLLISDATYKSTIQEMLFGMNVPVEGLVMDNIVRTARDMATDAYYNGHKVLRMSVCIDILIDEPVLQDLEAAFMDDDDDEPALAMVPATKSSIERLEMVVPASSIDCAICMEEVSVGLEAKRMPCLHIFHSGCIVNWLETSKYCPLCRFEVP